MVNSIECRYCIAHKSLKFFRVISGRTIKDVSTRIGVSPSTLVHYERRPESTPLNVAKKLAEEYGITIDDIKFSD